MIMIIHHIHYSEDLAIPGVSNLASVLGDKDQ